MPTELETHIRARYPLVYLLSWEEDRTKDTLDRICQGMKKMLFVWTETDGLCNYALPDRFDESKRDPLTVLDEIRRSRDNAIYALMDFHHFISDHTVIRKIKDLSAALKTTGKTVVFVSSVLTLPQELTKEVAVLDFDLPTLAELDAAFEELLKNLRRSRGVKVSLSDASREKVVKAAQGLTLAELEQVTAKAAVETKRIDESAVNVILSEKKQLIRKSGTLEYYPAEENFDEIGGLDSLKRWLRQRADAFTDEARAHARGCEAVHLQVHTPLGLHDGQEHAWIGLLAAVEQLHRLRGAGRATPGGEQRELALGGPNVDWVEKRHRHHRTPSSGDDDRGLLIRDLRHASTSAGPLPDRSTGSRFPPLP